MKLKHSPIKIRLVVSNNINSFRVVLLIHWAKAPLAIWYKVDSLLTRLIGIFALKA
jgi:hypothetical protein